jgi:glutamate-1-semialdehyde aminotransferase
MRGKVMMSFGIVALSGRFYVGALLTAILHTSSLTVGRVMANGFPAGMSAIRNRYLNVMFEPSGSWVTVERMVAGNDD